ncbi:MAG TPA: sialidase family protein [Candidatus Dormibacteraeota bacterium]|nr:sialidase family protein [Candidatus Dormibacteraeota bacterium]
MRLKLLILAAVSAFAVGQPLAAAADDNPQPVDFTNVMNAPAPVTGAVFGTAPAVKTGTAICTTATSSASNVNTDCTEPSVGPHNETSIAINPTNPLNMIGGANDYQLALNPGGQVSETILSRAHVTFDGGKTWSMFPVISNSAYQATGDPALAFDAAGHAYYGTLGFRFVGPANAQNPDILVSNSGDGGKTWDVVRVESGSGVETGVGDLLDKDYVAAWGDGNAIVTYGDFKLGQKGALISARIHAAVTHDGGQTWSTPAVISGSLDQAFVATPVVAADGRIFVSFLNTTDLKTGRDDYEVVEVDPATGQALGAPVKVATTIDGFTDFPIALGRQTYQDSVFRTWAAGNITADRTNAAHLAVVWSDMRNSTLPAPKDPYKAMTNSDIIVSQSFDRGRTWSSPAALALAGDQFMPWGAYDTSGKLRIGFFDRSVDPANHKYGYTLATERTGGSLSFTKAVISTVDSDPTTGDRWFARNVNPAFPHATAFLGDYSNIAATADGGVVAYWTDMRNDATFAGITRKGEDAFFARAG